VKVYFIESSRRCRGCVKCSQLVGAGTRNTLSCRANVA